MTVEHEHGSPFFYCGDYDDCGAILGVDDKTYALKSVHFHTPAENTVDGIAYPMEMHMVHAADDGALAVLGVLFEKTQKTDADDAVAEMLDAAGVNGDKGASRARRPHRVIRRRERVLALGWVADHAPVHGRRAVDAATSTDADARRRGGGVRARRGDVPGAREAHAAAKRTTGGRLRTRAGGVSGMNTRRRRNRAGVLATRNSMHQSRG